MELRFEEEQHCERAWERGERVELQREGIGVGFGNVAEDRGQEGSERGKMCARVMEGFHPSERLSAGEGGTRPWGQCGQERLCL